MDNIDEDLLNDFYSLNSNDQINSDINIQNLDSIDSDLLNDFNDIVTGKPVIEKPVEKPIIKQPENKLRPEETPSNWYDFENLKEGFSPSAMLKNIGNEIEGIGAAIYKTPKAYELGKEQLAILRDKSNVKDIESWRKLKSHEDYVQSMMEAEGISKTDNVIEKAILSTATIAPYMPELAKRVIGGIADGWTSQSMITKPNTLYSIPKALSGGVIEFLKYSFETAKGDAQDSNLKRIEEVRPVTQNDIDVSNKVASIAAVPYMIMDMVEFSALGKFAAKIPGWKKLKTNIFGKIMDYATTVGMESLAEGAQKIITDASSEITAKIQDAPIDETNKVMLLRIKDNFTNEVMQSIVPMAGMTLLGGGIGMVAGKILDKKFEAKTLPTLSETSIPKVIPKNKQDLLTAEGARLLIKNNPNAVKKILSLKPEDLSRKVFKDLTGAQGKWDIEERKSFQNLLIQQKKIIESEVIQNEKASQEASQKASSEKGAEEILLKPTEIQAVQTEQPSVMPMHERITNFKNKYGRYPDPEEEIVLKEQHDIESSTAEIASKAKEMTIEPTGNGTNIDLDHILLSNEPEIQEPQKEIKSPKIQLTKEEWDKIKDDPGLTEEIGIDEYERQEKYWDNKRIEKEDILPYVNESTLDDTLNDESGEINVGSIRKLGASIENFLFNNSRLIVGPKPKRPVKTKAMETNRKLIPGYLKRIKEFPARLKEWKTKFNDMEGEFLSGDLIKIKNNLEKVINQNKDSKNVNRNNLAKIAKTIYDQLDSSLIEQIGETDLIKELIYGQNQSRESRQVSKADKAIASRKSTATGDRGDEGIIKASERIQSSARSKIEEYQKSLEKKESEEPTSFASAKKAKIGFTKKKETQNAKDIRSDKGRKSEKGDVGKEGKDKGGEDIQLDEGKKQVSADVEQPTQEVREVESETQAAKGAISIDEVEKLEKDDFFDKTYGKTVIEGSIKLFEATKDLVKKYTEHIIGVGYQGRKNAGIFYRNTKNIFVQSLNNIGVVSHELAHFMSQKFNFQKTINLPVGFSKNGKPIYNSNYKELVKQLTEIYTEYYPGGLKNHSRQLRVEEGIATFIQKFIEEPTKTIKNYPLLIDWFLEKSGDFYNKTTIDFIKDTRAIIRNYNKLDALAKVGVIVKENISQKDKNLHLTFWERVRSAWVHRKYWVEKITKAAGMRGTMDDAYAWFEAYGYLPKLIGDNIESNNGFTSIDRDGNFIQKYKFNFKTLIDNLNKIGRREQFDWWLVARMQHFEYQRLDELNKESEKAEEQIKSIEDEIQSGEISEAEGLKLIDEQKKAVKEYNDLKDILDNDNFDRNVVSDAYDQHKDAFKEYAKMFDILQRENLLLLNNPQVQLLDDEKLKELDKKEGHASLKRFFDNEIIGEGSYKPSTPKAKISFMQKRKGSSKEIISPLYSMVKNHSECMRKAMGQIVWNKLYNLSIDNADIFQKLDRDLVFVDDKLISPYDKDPNVVMCMKNYKKMPLLVNHDLKLLIDTCLNPRNYSSVEKAFLFFTRTFTKGTTALDPLGFALKNIFRDSVTAFALSEEKYFPIMDQLKLINEALTNNNSEVSKYAKEYIRIAGTRQTYAGMQSKSPSEFFEYMEQEKNALNKILKLIDTGMDWVSFPSAASEIGTRMVEYIKARKSGKSSVVALEEAGRVSGSFHHEGNFGGSDFARVWIRSMPFFPATLQVLDREIEALKGGKSSRNRVLIAYLAVTALSVTGMGLLLSHGTDEQKKKFKALQPNELGIGIYFPSPISDNLLRYPIGPEFSASATLFNMMVADRFLGANYKIDEYYDAATSWLPDQFNLLNFTRAVITWLPQIVKIGVGQVAGITFWPNIRNMETQTEKSVEAEFRMRPNTTWLAKKIGHLLKLSPIKIDALIKDAGGRFGSDMSDLMGLNFTKKNPFVKDVYFSSSRQFQRFYDHKTQVERKIKSYKEGKLDLNDKEKEKYGNMSKYAKGIDKLLDTFRLYTDEEVRTKIKDPNSIKLRNLILDKMAEMEAIS